METTTMDFATFLRQVCDILNEHSLHVSKKVIGQLIGYNAPNHIYPVMNGTKKMSAPMLFNLLLLIGLQPQVVIQLLKDCKKFKEEMERQKNQRAKKKKRGKRKG